MITQGIKIRQALILETPKMTLKMKERFPEFGAHGTPSIPRQQEQNLKFLYLWSHHLHPPEIIPRGRLNSQIVDMYLCLFIKSRAQYLVLRYMKIAVASSSAKS